MPAPPGTATPTHASRLRGLLLGTAVGDALGLPMEGLSPGRAARLFPPPLRMRLLGGHGFVSDDTDHAVLTAQSLLAEPASAQRFARRLAWGLRGWILALPPGVGLATLRACGRLLLGFGPGSSGVASAGNGAAMRAPVAGAFLARDDDRREAFVAASTRITHTDARALVGARALAALAAGIVREELPAPPQPAVFGDLLRAQGPGDAEWEAATRLVERACEEGLPVRELAARMGLGEGVTGYTHATVPVVAYTWYRHSTDFRGAMEAVIGCGGDTDTTAALAGALVGATVGEEGIPAAWEQRILDWPRGPAFLRRLGDRLAAGEGGPVRNFWPGVPLRNALLLLIVLAHGVRRAFPPWNERIRVT